jgi:hypothetical protein
VIFLAGTNLDGRHGAGSARYAYLYHGLKMGVAEGLCGNTYALPTVGSKLARMMLPEVEGAVERFIQFAAQHPELQFQVTRVGCGLAGFTDAEIAPLFAASTPNCLFDEAWSEWLSGREFWGTV